MAQQLQDFTIRMMEGVVRAHANRTDHDAYCCALATEYANTLRQQGKKDEDLFSPRYAPTPANAVPAQRKSDTRPKPVPSKAPADPNRKATDKQLDYILSLGRRVAIELLSPKHRTHLQHVREGFGLLAVDAQDLIEALLGQTNQSPRPASDAQIRYLHSLVKTREWDGTIDFENLTVAVASGLINDLKNRPRKAVPEGEPVYTTESKVPEVGVYLVNGTYYVVQEARTKGANRYAKRWQPEAGKFVYDGQKSFRLIKPENLITAEQASEFGKMFGHCVALGCELTNEVSLHWGYGEKCAENNGWPYHSNY